MGAELQYSISFWEQLPNCLSNLSSKYRIVVNKYTDEHVLHGIGISVVHKEYGTVYSRLVDADGTIVNNKYITASYPEVLEDLKAFGFIIFYTPHKHLQAHQLQMLMALRDLNYGYDKIRIIAFKDKVNAKLDDKAEYRVVMFNSTFLPKWLNNTYVSSRKEYTDALDRNYCTTVSKIAEKQEHEMWDWLKDYVFNIDDVLEENSR